VTDKPTLVADGDNILIRIPMRFKKRGGRKEIIAPEGLDRALPDAGPAQQPIVTALARARRWQEMLDNGEVGSVTELADRLDADRSYVARILRLNLLAPDIVEAILAGREPSGLSLAKLTQTLPILWHEQREMFGFPPD
jgi:hypothetical protein